jgi:hypothetical protein
MYPISAMLIVMLLAAKAQLVLDPHSVVKSFNLIKAIVPLNDSSCALEPGSDRLLLGFDALAYNVGDETIRKWTFDWSYACDVSRHGTIQINCTSDTKCFDVEPRYFSCAVSGVQAGCATQVRPKPCQFIDLTDAGPNCILYLDERAYNLSTLKLSPDDFIPRFAFALTITESLTLLALGRALSQPAL